MKKVLVRGPALSASGYGEQCRFALQALREHEEKYDIFLENINWGRTGWIPFDDENRGWIDELIGKTFVYRQNGGTFDISLQVTIPNEWKTDLAPYNVGYTAGIETTKIAPHWIEPSNKMDKIVVVSNHAKYGFENTVYQARNPQTGEEVPVRVDTPVEVVGYAVKEIEPENIELEFDYEFNFLSVCQWGPRKDLESTVVSFVEEFHDEEVGLVLKTSIARNNTIDKIFCKKRFEEFLDTFPDRKCKVYLIHGNLTESEMAGLYTHPKIKAMVSTTHGEGFGLPLFEAVGHGLPILAPNWSGHVDFLYAPVKDKKKQKMKMRPHFLKIAYDLKPVQKAAVWEGVIQPDSKWCFVDRNSVRRSLREVYKNYPQRVAIAKRLQTYVNQKFNKEEIYQQFVDAVYEIDDDWENELDEISED